jgi:uncharacterized protein YdiU (UPF0061 family)
VTRLPSGPRLALAADLNDLIAHRIAAVQVQAAAAERLLDAADSGAARAIQAVRGLTADAMDEVNPLYIPRNHQVDAALRAATDGDLLPFTTLLEIVTHPFGRRDEWSNYAVPAPRQFTESFRTFCGT